MTKIDTPRQSDYLDIKEWAKAADKKARETIDFYISNGWSKEKAFHKVMDSSTLGAGCKSQIRHDYNISIFN